MQAFINLEEKPSIAVSGQNVHYAIDHYLLPQHWSLHLYDYHARLWVDERPIDLYPGCVTLVPPGAHVEYHFQGRSSHLYAHFELPQVSPEAGIALPVAYDMRSELHRFEHSMQTMTAAFLFNKTRAEIKLWDMLWELVAHGESVTTRRHASLEKALTLIARRLGEDISVTALAREVGLSRNHLTRLFRQDTGLTVVAYVRQQRARHAQHLLEHTAVPISRIAREVNAPTLQSFSALIKKETGHSPNHWRRQR